MFEDGKSGADLLRRKVVRKEYSDSDDSLSDSNGSEASGKPRKPTKKRKRRAVDDEELNARKEKRRLADLEKRATIKSAMRIVDSDDDDDDAEFFQREKELRERMARKALEGELPSSGTRKITAKKRPEKQSHVFDLDRENGSVNDETAEIEIQKSASPISTTEIDEDRSENSDIDDVRLVKKRKIRRAVSITSDE